MWIVMLSAQSYVSLSSSRSSNATMPKCLVLMDVPEVTFGEHLFPYLELSLQGTGFFYSSLQQQNCYHGFVWMLATGLGQGKGFGFGNSTTTKHALFLDQIRPPRCRHCLLSLLSPALAHLPCQQSWVGRPLWSCCCAWGHFGLPTSTQAVHSCTHCWGCAVKWSLLVECLFHQQCCPVGLD